MNPESSFELRGMAGRSFAHWLFILADVLCAFMVFMFVVESAFRGQRLEVAPISFFSLLIVAFTCIVTLTKKILVKVNGNEITVTKSFGRSFTFTTSDITLVKWKKANALTISTAQGKKLRVDITLKNCDMFFAYIREKVQPDKMTAEHQTVAKGMVVGKSEIRYGKKFTVYSYGMFVLFIGYVSMFQQLSKLGSTYVLALTSVFVVLYVLCSLF